MFQSSKATFHFVKDIHNFFRAFICGIRKHFANLSSHFTEFIASIKSASYCTTDTNYCDNRGR
ncbi:hypothetical protein AERO9A_330006 [Aeromonas salmonicida]|nr:hypothetical protein AERO9A_330006 [Aeromonas salmonicida]